MSEKLKLLPCPACGEKSNIGIHQNTEAPESRRFGVSCHTKGCTRERNVTGATPSEAYCAWNSFPRALTWTTEPPKVAGHYWCRYKGEGSTSWSVAYVPAVTDWEHYDMGEHDRIEWAGPIPLPKEPTP